MRPNVIVQQHFFFCHIQTQWLQQNIVQFYIRKEKKSKLHERSIKRKVSCIYARDRKKNFAARCCFLNDMSQIIRKWKMFWVVHTVLLCNTKFEHKFIFAQSLSFLFFQYSLLFGESVLHKFIITLISVSSLYKNLDNFKRCSFVVVVKMLHTFVFFREY